MRSKRSARHYKNRRAHKRYRQRHYGPPSRSPVRMALLSGSLVLTGLSSPVFAASGVSVSGYSVATTGGSPTITIAGSGFGASATGSAVTVSGVSAPIDAWSDTSITVNLPANAGPGPIVVTTPAGASAPVTFAGIQRGYYVLSPNGQVTVEGGVQFYGDLTTLGVSGTSPAVALVPAPGYQGYWILTQNGQTYAFGHAPPLGNTPPGVTAVGFAVTASGQGAFVLAADGTVYPLGTASHYGNAPAATPVSAIAATPDGQGYWILASDGTVYPFGDAANLGNAPAAPAPPPTYPAGSLLRVAGTSPVFLLQNGQLHHIPNPQILFGLGDNWNNVAVVPNLSNIPQGLPLVVPFPSGTLLKPANSPAVYLVMGGVLRHIASASVFLAMGYQWSQIAAVPALGANWPVGPDITTPVAYFPSGTLLKAAGSPAVYMVASGVLRHITTPAVFAAMGFNWSQIHPVAALPSLPVGPDLTAPARAYPSGSLVKVPGRAPVYLVQNGVLRHIQSPAALYALGYDFSGVQSLPSLAGQIVGADLGSTAVPSGTVPAAPPSVALVPTADGKGYWIMSSTGQITALGDAKSFGSPSSQAMGTGTAVALALTPDQQGYDVLTSRGQVLPFGDAAAGGGPPQANGLVISPEPAGSMVSMGYGFFIDNATGGSYQDLTANAAELTAINPAWFNLTQNPDGTWTISSWTTQVPPIQGQSDITVVTNTAHAAHVLVLPSVAAYYNPANGPITTTQDVSSLISQIVNLVTANNLDGITIDLENNSAYTSAMTEADASQQYTAFIEQLGVALHAIGKKLMVAVYPTSYPATIYNFAALAPYVDYINLMAYPQHNSSTYAGPTAGFPWVHNIVTEALATGVSAQKFILGVAPYGHYWTFNNTSGMVGQGYISNRGVKTLVSSDGLTPVWDPVEKEIVFTAGAPATAPPAPLSTANGSSYSPAVQNLQGLLNYILLRYAVENGQAPLPLLWTDGYYGSVTASDLALFQQDFNVPASSPGVYDAATAQALANVIATWHIGQDQYWDETSRSFADRLQLAAQYGLAGVASWRMPFETPGYWTALATRTTVIHY